MWCTAVYDFIQIPLSLQGTAIVPLIWAWRGVEAECVNACVFGLGWKSCCVDMCLWGGKLSLG